MERSVSRRQERARALGVPCAMTALLVALGGCSSSVDASSPGVSNVDAGAEPASPGQPGGGNVDAGPQADADGGSGSECFLQIGGRVSGPGYPCSGRRGSDGNTLAVVTYDGSAEFRVIVTRRPMTGAFRVPTASEDVLLFRVRSTVSLREDAEGTVTVVSDGSVDDMYEGHAEGALMGTGEAIVFRWRFQGPTYRR